MDRKPTYFKNAGTFRSWLEKNHAKETELWLGFYKIKSSKKGITYAEAIDESLCYGWIDGLKNAHDVDSYKLRFTPRRSKSVWSKINVEKVKRLTKEGRMKPAGLAQVELAKKDGRLKAAYASQSTITVPQELKKLFIKHPKTKKFFESLSSANRYAFLYRIHTATKPETRAKRVEVITEMLLEEKTFHPEKKKG